MNMLYYGDCLTVMQGMPVGSVDLIYLDPPFNSQRNYHSIYKDETGRALPDQVGGVLRHVDADAGTRAGDSKHAGVGARDRH